MRRIPASPAPWGGGRRERAGGTALPVAAEAESPRGEPRGKRDPHRAGVVGILPPAGSWGSLGPVLPRCPAGEPKSACPVRHAAPGGGQERDRAFPRAVGALASFLEGKLCVGSPPFPLPQEEPPPAPRGGASSPPLRPGMGRGGHGVRSPRAQPEPGQAAGGWAACLSCPPASAPRSRVAGLNFFSFPAL